MALSAVPFRDQELEERVGLITSAEEPVLQPVDLALEIRREVSDGHSVRAAAAVVVPNSLEGQPKVAARQDLVEHPHLLLRVRGVADRRDLTYKETRFDAIC